MANNIPILDKDGATAVVKTTDSGGIHTPHHHIDSLPALPAGANAIGTVGVTALPALPAGANAIGSVAVSALPALPAGANAIGSVSVSALPTLANVTTVGTVTTLTGAGIAHDGADSGNPHKIGAKAVAQLNAQTLVAANDRTNIHADLDGALIVRTETAIGDLVSATASTTGTGSTQVLAAGAAGIKHHLTDVTIANSSAVDITVNLLDGATVRWTWPVPAKGGVTHQFRSPLVGAAATAWNFQASGAATTVYCSVSGYKSKL